MDWITVSAVVVVAAACAAGALLFFRRGPRAERLPDQPWVQRSGAERRRRSDRVGFDRRNGPRRQEDIARLFMASINA